MAVEQLNAVRSVDTDMDRHTLTVAFDDEQLSVDAIVGALNQAGYTVPGYARAESFSITPPKSPKACRPLIKEASCIGISNPQILW